MTLNPLEKAIKSAASASDRLAVLFAKSGNSQHPRGMLATAYRNAGRGMTQALQERNKRAAVAEVMRGLQMSVMGSQELFSQAAVDGIGLARQQLGYYGVSTPLTSPEVLGVGDRVTSALNVLTGLVSVQQAKIDALLVAGMDDLVLGDESRLGVLRPGELLAAAAFWLAVIYWDGFSMAVKRYSREGQFKKQAIAAIDSRTTDCCLRVHGQVARLDGDFTLTGTPRYADKMPWSPFHAWCRTSVALYQDEFDDGITEHLERSAQVVLDERSRGENKVRRPADAYS